MSALSSPSPDFLRRAFANKLMSSERVEVKRFRAEAETSLRQAEAAVDDVGRPPGVDREVWRMSRQILRDREDAAKKTADALFAATLAGRDMPCPPGISPAEWAKEKRHVREMVRKELMSPAALREMTQAIFQTKGS